MGKDKEEKKAKKSKDESEAAEKAEKKEKKKKKREAEEAAAAAATEEESKKDKKKKKKDKSEDADEDKAAKKAAKKAKREAEAAAAEEPPTKKPKAETPAAPAAEDEARVYVGNLPFSMTDEWITEEFQGAGAKIAKVEWLTHADTGRFKGAGFVTVASSAVANSAVTALNGKELEGRPMKVELATPKKAAFTPTNTDPGEPSESIFVGNLSWSITEEALRDTFKDCGDIARIKWLEKDGEFKGIAFVDFETVDAATKAVAKAGTDVMGRPLRINFSKSKGGGGGDKWGSGGGAGGGFSKPGRVERPYKPQGEKPADCTELFCGNLPWSIDEDKITQFFKGAGATVTGTRWLNDKETGEFKGIGFVTFESTGDVDKAVGLGGEQLDGRPIRLDYAGNKPKTNAWGGGGGGGW